MNGKYQQLVLTDGGNLSALKAKGNLTHLTNLYNPGNFFYKVHIITTNATELSIDLGNPTIILHHIPLIASRTPWNYILNQIRLIQALIKIVNQNNIDLIRARMPFLAGLRALLVARLTKRPMLVSLGGDNRLANNLMQQFPIWNNRFFSERVEEIVVHNADIVICINEFTRRYVLKLGARHENTRYVPHRIDLDRYMCSYDSADIRTRLTVGTNAMVLFIGRLTPYKGVDALIESIPTILMQHPQTKFVFAGDGNLRNDLERRSKTLKIESAVIFCGFLANNLVAQALASASVCWIPMSGFVVYEAAAAGAPIVACDVEWHSEFVINEQTGLLVPNRNINAMAHAVSRLLSDRNLAQSLAAAAREKMVYEFNPQKLISDECAIYADIITKCKYHK
jgi:glycosyltransferase involved in cell wall biosynthesis